MAIPSVSWDESNPSGSQARALGDDRIRELKTQLREVVAVDHIMASSGNSNNTGFHNKCTFYKQASSPLPVLDTFVLFAKTISAKTELFMDNYEANAEMQLTSNGQFIGGFKYEIRMFSGLTANIPAGWVLCDGNNDTPNLHNYFVRGYAIAITSRVFPAQGNDTHLHQITEHTHSIAGHTHTVSISGDVSQYHSNTSQGSDHQLANRNHSHSVTTGDSGTLTAGNNGTVYTPYASNVPAYIALAYIMKT